METHNNIVIISGPSGAGEDSIIDVLSQRLPVERIITSTTRSKRVGETEGHPYYFVSTEEFEKGIQEDRFFEWAQQYNDQYYGVTFEEIKRVQESGKVGIWKIDYKGVKSAKELISEVPAIFVNAPLDILEARIRRREGVSDAYIEERMSYTKEWLKHTDVYDYKVDNIEGKLEETVDQVEAIIRTELGLDK